MLPFAIAAAANAAVGIASTLLGASEQDKAARANKRAAKADAALQIQQLVMRQRQMQQNSARSIFMADLEARRADAITRVSAGESGVEGASVDMILADIERQRLQATTDEQQNLKNMNEQAGVERQGIYAQMRARINSVPESNPWATALQIGGHLANSAAAVGSRLPTPAPGA